MEFEKLTDRLKSEGIPFNIFDTGSCCFVLFIRFSDGSELSITPTEDEGVDPSDYWQVCDNATREAFWDGGSTELDECASTGRVVELVRQRQRETKIIEIIAGPENV